MKNIPDRKTLIKIKDYWVKILGLQEWEIVIKFARGNETELEEVAGEVIYQFDSKRALINILDQKDWTNVWYQQDMESTLVHELLHLKFAILTEGKNSERYQHQLLYDMTRAFMKLKEGK